MLRHESATGAHVSPSWTPLPPPSPPHPSGVSQCTAFECIELHWWSISHMVMYMFQCYSLTSSHPLPLPQSPKVCSLYLCLFCCLAYRVIIIVFLNSIYIYINALIYCIRCFSFWLTSLCIVGSSFIHVIITDLNAFFFYSRVILHCVYIPQLPYAFIGRWTSRLNSASFVKNVCCNSFFCLLWL